MRHDSSTSCPRAAGLPAGINGSGAADAVYQFIGFLTHCSLLEHDLFIAVLEQLAHNAWQARHRADARESHSGRCGNG